MLLTDPDRPGFEFGILDATTKTRCRTPAGWRRPRRPDLRSSETFTLSPPARARSGPRSSRSRPSCPMARRACCCATSDGTARRRQQPHPNRSRVPCGRSLPRDPVVQNRMARLRADHPRGRRLRRAQGEPDDAAARLHPRQLLLAFRGSVEDFTKALIDHWYGTHDGRPLIEDDPRREGSSAEPATPADATGAAHTGQAGAREFAPGRTGRPACGRPGGRGGRAGGSRSPRDLPALTAARRADVRGGNAGARLLYWAAIGRLMSPHPNRLEVSERRDRRGRLAVLPGGASPRPDAGTRPVHRSGRRRARYTQLGNR